MSKADGTERVVVLISSYPYHGHTYLEGETIDMDNHDVSGPVGRGQVRVKGTPKPVEKKSKGPSETMATGPSENR